jgi:aldose 1-epimerase
MRELTMRGIERDIFGRTADGQTVERYTLVNGRGMKVRIITFGATVTELWTPDRDGNLADVVLGFDDVSSYETLSPYFGAIVGRVAFRVVGAEFTLDGKRHRLLANDGPHQMHGGRPGFSHLVWRAEPLGDVVPSVKFTLLSPDGDQGYPGTLDTTVIYSLDDDNSLRIDCAAKTDRPTLVNLTHHSYFNLAGAGNGDVLDHRVEIDADHWIPAPIPDMPTGEIADVGGTPFDFRKPMTVGSRIHEAGGSPEGYDLCYLHNHAGEGLARVAAVEHPASGRVMEVSTNEPGIVLYTGNFLDGSLRGKQGKAYPQHAALCLETGRPPDAIHHAKFPPIVVRPGDPYRHQCVYRFSAK